MSDGLVRVRVHAPSGTIVLNRPAKRNALTRAMVAELSQALSDLHLERRVRAVILTGAGSAFCAGLDLSEIRENAGSDRAGLGHSATPGGIRRD